MKKLFYVIIFILACSFAYADQATFTTTEKAKLDAMAPVESGTLANQMLYWNGTSWLPSTGTDKTKLDGIETGADLTPLDDGTAAGQITYWNGTRWKAANDAFVKYDSANTRLFAYPIFTDKFLSQTNNTIFGINAAGAGTLAHGSGNEGYYNNLFGEGAGYSLTTAFANSLNGYHSGYLLTTGSGNVAIGQYTLDAGTTGTANCVAIGASALTAATTASSIAIGSSSLYSATTASGSIAIGTNASFNTTNYSSSVGVGDSVTRNFGTVSQCVNIGAEAGYGAVSQSITSYNVNIGFRAGQNMLSGADYNTNIGYTAGDAVNYAGDYNIIIGAGQDPDNVANSYQLNIGGFLKCDNFNTGRIVRLWGAYKYIDAASVADDAYIDLPASVSGFGTVQMGDDAYYAQFRFKADGTVALIVSNGSVVTADTDTNLCIFDNGSNVRIKNRSGGALYIRADIVFSGN